MERLLRFCREEDPYYDGIPSACPNKIEPMDVLATLAMSSYLSAEASAECTAGCPSTATPILAAIPADRNLSVA